MPVLARLMIKDQQCGYEELLSFHKNVTMPRCYTLSATVKNGMCCWLFFCQPKWLFNKPGLLNRAGTHGLIMA
jgi:hypothetical protein